jgi:hypothetical protein
MMKSGQNPAAEKLVNEMEAILAAIRDLVHQPVWSAQGYYEPSRRRVLELLKKFQGLQLELIRVTQAPFAN